MTLEWTRLVWAILCLCVDHTIGQRSPCPNVFQYEYDGYEWYGLITPQNFPVEATNQLKVELSLEAELPSNYVGSLGLSQSSEVSVQKIEANEPFSYILRFPIQSTLPEVIQITINGETICSGSQGGSYASKMTLTHKLFYSAFTTRYYTVYLRNRYEATTTLPAIYLRNQDDNAISSRQYVAKTTQVPIYSLSERSGVESTCADIFKYQFEGGEWIGLIEPQSFIAGPTIKLEIKLSLNAVLPSKYVGTLRTLESLETTIEKIKRNQPFSYKITFPTQSPLPKVTKITINEQTMCSGLPESSPYFSSIGLSYTIYSDLQIAQFSNSNSIRLRYESPTTMRSITRTTSPTFTGPFTTTTKRTTTTTKRTTTTTKPTTTTTKRTTTTTKPTTTTIKPTTTTTLPTTTTTLPTTTTTLPTTTTMLPTTTTTFPTTTTTLPTTTTTLPNTMTTNSIATSQATKTVQPAFSNPECGIVDLDTLDMTFLRIINPKETVKGQYPFLAALFELTDSGREFFCGGTLITTNHVLTAAHCIQPKFNPQKRKNADDILLLLGKYNLMGEEKSDIRSPVEKIHVNPSWDVDNERYDGDLAILSLSITVSFSKYVRPVCLPNINENINRMRGLIAGWGLLDNNNTPATTLKHAGISVDTDCFFEDGELSRIASKRTFCGKGDGAPNEGDSGGGFFARSNGKWTQYGIISTVRTDKHRAVITGAFSVYTNVMDFIDWIDQTIN